MPLTFRHGYDTLHRCRSEFDYRTLELQASSLFLLVLYHTAIRVLSDHFLFCKSILLNPLALCLQLLQELCPCIYSLKKKKTHSMGRLSIPTYNSLFAPLQSFPLSSRVEDNSGGCPRTFEIFLSSGGFLRFLLPLIAQTTGVHCQQTPILFNWQQIQCSKTLNSKPSLLKKGFHGFLGTNFTVLG